ncbi:hypothetical protein BJY16_001402 [Actinoplanes octamycinicus]|uniref:Uncharacterized protein n=1 Tax=Actinoplanes octamycinicus TaxID=135948 RepID=A0A7W7M5P8_9ACTN|nr:hypothetical protein [Actinoplanes octamycinicus]
MNREDQLELALGLLLDAVEARAARGSYAD